MRHNMRNQGGFTLVELVITTVILGILSITALPKLIDFTTNSKEAVVESTAGSFQSSANLVRMYYIS